MKNRNYLDYNATSPLSKSVIRFLGKGDFPFANPSSLHSFGQESRKLINNAIDSIYSTFFLSEKEFDIVFHSGSTEGINIFFNSITSEDCFFYCAGDHPATLSLVEKLTENSVECFKLPINAQGDLRLEESIELINSKKKKAFVNFLCAHNETGVYWPLELAQKLKEATNAYVHVDATQVPGKIHGWDKLSPELDGYVFSSHKFGGLKGSGFSFIKKSFPIRPLFKGGGQQSSMRGGTENPLGCHCSALALRDLKDQDLNAIEKLRDELEAIIESRDDIEIIGKGSRSGRALNTSNFVLNKTKADIGLIQFDMAGLAVSSGSACSAGSVAPSKVLLEMGLGERARNGIRVSLGAQNLENKKEILESFKTVLEKL